MVVNVSSLSTSQGTAREAKEVIVIIGEAPKEVFVMSADCIDQRPLHVSSHG